MGMVGNVLDCMQWKQLTDSMEVGTAIGSRVISPPYLGFAGGDYVVSSVRGRYRRVTYPRAKERERSATCFFK
jgi:hypothetical protein